jgi:hypothetical protein
MDWRRDRNLRAEERRDHHRHNRAGDFASCDFNLFHKLSPTPERDGIKPQQPDRKGRKKRLPARGLLTPSERR